MTSGRSRVLNDGRFPLLHDHKIYNHVFHKHSTQGVDYYNHVFHEHFTQGVDYYNHVFHEHFTQGVDNYSQL